MNDNVGVNSMVEWARKELGRLVDADVLQDGEIVDDEGSLQREINKDILELLTLFYSQGHSGFTAPYVVNMLRLLVNGIPPTPLTGEENEWECHEGIDQNNRCSAVFREHGDNSTAYYINGKVFSDDGGETWFTNNQSCVPVTFPFLVPEQPERVYIENNKGEM